MCFITVKHLAMAHLALIKSFGNRLKHVRVIDFKCTQYGQGYISFFRTMKVIRQKQETGVREQKAEMVLIIYNYQRLIL